MSFAAPELFQLTQSLSTFLAVMFSIIVHLVLCVLLWYHGYDLSNLDSHQFLMSRHFTYFGK